MRLDTILYFDGGYLRTLIAKDVHDGYVNGLNDKQVNKYLDGAKHFQQTFQSVEDYVITNEKSPNSILFGIWDAKSETHCGTVRLHGIELQHFTAYIGICIFDKTFWGKGLGSRVISAITEWAMKELKIRWIEASIYSDNVASQKVFLKSGYTWIFDIEDKFLLEGKPAKVKYFSAKKNN